ncbi:hypothetical protein L9F63_004296, partial [Diploptera punctata]
AFPAYSLRRHIYPSERKKSQGIHLNDFCTGIAIFTNLTLTTKCTCGRIYRSSKRLVALHSCLF